MAVSPISGVHRRQGKALLDRQCWNWGRDIVSPEGNLLLEAGFTRRRPPAGEAGSSCYTLALPGGDSLRLWGFGLLYGTPRQGGVFLNRYQFRPVWLPSEAAQEPIWSPDIRPTAKRPPSPRVAADLTVAAARRVADYEEWVLARCGLEYRCVVLSQWKGRARGLPPEEVPQAWRALADAIDGQPPRRRRSSAGAGTRAAARLVRSALEQRVPVATDH